MNDFSSTYFKLHSKLNQASTKFLLLLFQGTMEMNSILKLVTLVVIFNSINARSITKTPITQECRDTIRNVYFKGKDSVKLSDWSRIYLEQSHKASRAIRFPKWAPDAAADSFHEIDLNKNELIELDEFEKEYLDKIQGYFFTAGETIDPRALFISDGWSKEKINKNTYNCEFFDPMRTYTFLGYVALYPLTRFTMAEPTLGYTAKDIQKIADLQASHPFSFPERTRGLVDQLISEN